MAHEKQPINPTLHFEAILAAAEKGHLTEFTQLIEPILYPTFNPFDYEQLLQYRDLNGDTLFHHLLSIEKGLFKRNKQKIKMQMLQLLLNPQVPLEALNTPNREGYTALHLAIKLGNVKLLEVLLAKGARLETLTREGLSALELAASHKQMDIYEKLLKKHAELNIRFEGGVGFTCPQIVKAHSQHKKNLHSKYVTMGIFGTLIAIACPVGAIMAFNELPVLEILLLPLIAGLSVSTIALIGITAGVLIGLGLFLSTKHKAGAKYGAEAQEMAALEATEALITRLTAELKSVNNGMKREPSNELKDKRDAIIRQLDEIYGRVEEVPVGFLASGKPLYGANSRNDFSEPIDWANWKDKLYTHGLMFASFVCSFSGVLGIFGAAAPFIPTMLLTSALLTGIPLVGWAIGSALLVATVIYAWTLYSKYSSTLEQFGKTRQELHLKKVRLYERKHEFLQEKQLSARSTNNINNSLNGTSENSTEVELLSTQQPVSQASEKFSLLSAISRKFRNSDWSFSFCKPPENELVNDQASMATLNHE